MQTLGRNEHVNTVAQGTCTRPIPASARLPARSKGRRPTGQDQTHIRTHVNIKHKHTSAAQALACVSLQRLRAYLPAVRPAANKAALAVVSAPATAAPAPRAALAAAPPRKTPCISPAVPGPALHQCPPPLQHSLRRSCVQARHPLSLG